jgi:hypothetical protein
MIWVAHPSTMQLDSIWHQGCVIGTGLAPSTAFCLPAKVPQLIHTYGGVVPQFVHLFYTAYYHLQLCVINHQPYTNNLTLHS